MNEDTRVCETCLDAAADEGLARDREAAMFCTELGDELADHLCEEIELDGETRCMCSCHQLAKQALRREATKIGGAS